MTDDVAVFRLPNSNIHRGENGKFSYALRCLSCVALYGKGILQLPTSSLTMEFKCTKVRTELLLSGSKDAGVKEVTPNPTKGRKWNPRVAVQEAEAALQLLDMQK